MGAGTPTDESQGLPQGGPPQDTGQDRSEAPSRDDADVPSGAARPLPGVPVGEDADSAPIRSEFVPLVGPRSAGESGGPSAAVAAPKSVADRLPPPPPPVVRPLSSQRPAAGSPPPRRTSRSGCLLVIAVVGTVVLVGSVGFLLFLGNLADLVPSGAAGLPTSGGGKIRKEVLLDGTLGSEREIAVIDVRGMILYDAPFDGASARSICGQLKAAKEDESVVGVILDMNTPGGEVTASDEIHRAVLKLRETGKPVVTCMHAMGASGGYFIAAGTDCIVANRLTLTGSIGVLIGTLNYAGLFEKIGLESEVYKSGKMKDLLAGGRTRTEAEKALVNELVTSNFHAFAQVVADGRERYRSRADVLAAEFADGRVLSGEQALASGLVDQLGYFEDAVAKARELADASGAKVVRLRRALRFSDLLMSMKAPQVGALRNFLPQEIRSLQPGRYYYLTPTVLE